MDDVCRLWDFIGFHKFLISFITDITNRTDILTVLTKDLRSGNHVELGHKVSLGIYIVFILFSGCFYCSLLLLFMLLEFKCFIRLPDQLIMISFG